MKLFQPWKSHFHVLLLHPTEAKVLLQKSLDRYCLPSVEINQRVQLGNVETIKAATESELGISVNVLHYASYQIEPAHRKVHGIYVLEQYEATQAIQVGVWCDQQKLNAYIH